MELLSPAGNVDKLRYCYTYGADAAYIGLKNFSLRVKADNFYEDEYKKVAELKRQFPGRRLHCALNISFHNSEIDRLISDIPYFKQYPIDAFIVQDLGIVPILQKHFPNAELHLSTQASCMNREAVKMYRSLGFSRVVMGREASLEEVAEIKNAVPDMEIECFVHGAMCIAYAGRCLMSAYLNGRSAQEGFCSHTCRWEYEALIDRKEVPGSVWNDSPYSKEARALAQSGALTLKETTRPDEYFPVYEGDNFTALLSSKDLCMIDHLADLKKAGVDSLKIEGRMKSIYYVALITRAYRKALDALENKISEEDARPFVDELYKVSHRPYGTGFYYNKAEADITVSGASESPWELAGELICRRSETEADDVFAKARELQAKREAEYNAMVPAAQKAFDERVRNQKDRYLPPLDRREGWHLYRMNPLNMINEESELEAVTPDTVSIAMNAENTCFANPVTGETYRWVCNGHPCVLYSKLSLPDGTLVRVKSTQNR